MKKLLIIFGVSAFSLILTVLLADIFSLYHFGSIPTLLTLIYLLLIFSILCYLMLSAVYIFSRLIKKEKLNIKILINIFLFFSLLISVLLFVFNTEIDWINYYSQGHSAPFHLFVIKNAIKTLVAPTLLVILYNLIFMKNKK